MITCSRSQLLGLVIYTSLVFIWIRSLPLYCACIHVRACTKHIHVRVHILVCVIYVCLYICRTHYRRQKRWWSAYLLFYDRADQSPVFDGELKVHIIWNVVHMYIYKWVSRCTRTFNCYNTRCLYVNSTFTTVERLLRLTVMYMYVYIVHKCMVCTTKMTVRSHSNLFPPLTEALQTSPTIPKPMKSVVHKQNLEFLHHKSHYNFAYFQFMKNFLIMNSSHIRTILERNPQQAVRLYSCDCTYVHIQMYVYVHVHVHVC